MLFRYHTNHKDKHILSYKLKDRMVYLSLYYSNSHKHSYQVFGQRDMLK